MSSDEAKDADAVGEALVEMHEQRFAAAYARFASVAANTPGVYANTEEDAEGKLVIRFWDQDEFLWFVMRMKESGRERFVIWKHNAYPKAHFYLGFLEVHRQNYAAAVRWLDLGHRLQPDQPLFALEKAQALQGLGDIRGTVACYEWVLSMGLAAMPARRAQAMRGKARILIDEQRLDEAAALFHESLVLVPDNELARHELQYIAHLRGGGAQVGYEVASSTAQPVASNWKCQACGVALPAGGKLEPGGLLCARCAARS